MKICYGSDSLPRRFKKSVVTLGVFDGVHRGHQSIFQAVVKRARQLRAPSLVYSFDPHPVHVLAPVVPLPLLNTLSQRAELIGREGIDCLLMEPFTKDFARQSAKDFFEKIILDKLKAREIFVGYDFTFGAKRSGKTEVLESLGQQYGIPVTIVPAFFEKDCLISSTEIRHAINRGEVKRASRLLGHDFFVEGDVIRGQGLGRTFGIRTANIHLENEFFPMSGVYASLTSVDKKKYKSVTNIGLKPTFGGTNLSIETHLLDFDGNLYRKKLRIEFVERIREERIFSGIETLKEQIDKDIKIARRLLKAKR